MDGVDGGAWAFGDNSFPRATRTYFAGTFCKFPLSMAAVDAVLQRLEAEGEGIYAGLEAATARLASELNAWWALRAFAPRIDHCGSIFRFNVPKVISKAFTEGLIRRGIYCVEGRACFLSTAHSTDDVQRIVLAVQQATEELHQSVLIPLRADAPAAASHGSPLQLAAGVPLRDRLPVSSLQHQLLLHQQLHPTSSAYNEPIAVPLGDSNIGTIDEPEPLVRAALQSLVRRHAVLRTCYGISPDREATRLCQIVLPSDGFVVPLVVCSDAAQWEELLHSELRSPFRPFAAPPIRALYRAVDPALLVVNVHHVAVDAVAMHLIRSELREHCLALARGQTPAALAPLAYEYADFAQLEASRADDQEALDWWVSRLQGVSELLTLPADFPRPLVQATSARHVPLFIGESLMAQVTTLCRACGATINAVLLTLWAELLHRLSDDTSVIVGVPHSLRHAKNLEHVVGTFVNTLPIRLDRQHGTVLEAIRYVQHEVGEALQRAHVPLHRIIHACGKSSRSAAYSPLFQTMFHATNDQEADALDATVDEPTVKLDLEVEFLYSNDKARGKMIYDPAIFSAETAQRWAAFLLHLIQEATAHPDSKLGEVQAYDDGEAERVLPQLNATAVDFGEAATLGIHDLVDYSSNRVALEWGEAKMTYKELGRCSDAVAAWLRARESSSRSVVALQLHRSLEQIVGLLGALKSGSAYLPLDPKWPLERRRYMARDATCEHLLAQTVYVHEFEGWFEGAILRLDDARAVPLTTGPEMPRPRKQPDLAYIMFTSGSTGRPKGVMVPHAGVVNLLLGARRRYGAAENAIFGMPTPYTFDVSVYNIFSSLAVFRGTCRLLADGSQLATPTRGEHWTHLAAVPSILAVSRLPPSVEHVQVGGEALTQPAVDSVPKHATLYNYYGPTEAAIWATRSIVSRDSPARLSLIGSPLPNVTCFVVDLETRRLVPIGVYGELWLGGVQVARGYLNQPELTAERFIINPWAHADPSGRGIVYRTGDRARWCANGELEFGGRMDFQVKLRGQRIELGEIEHALRAQPGVHEAVVQLWTEGIEPSLIAYVTPKEIVGGDEAQPLSQVPALEGLRQTLPVYMLPSLIIGLNAWPRTASDKIDRNKLPAPIVKTSQPAPLMAAREEIDGLGGTIVQTVSEQLRRHLASDVALDAPLMDAGLNSLQSVVLVSQLADLFKLSLPATLLFEAPTTRLLSEYLAGCVSGRSAPNAAPTTRARVAAPVPLGPVAIASANHRFPGIGSGALRMLSQSCDVICEVPPNRWDDDHPFREGSEAVGSRVRYGGFLCGHDLFDASMFNVAAAEAVAMDPQQRLLLEQAYAALHAAEVVGPRRSDRANLTGVFVGLTAFEFAYMLATRPGNAYTATGADASIASGRISYVLDLHGPCISYDTACSTALVATHAAVRTIQQSECHAAVSAAVNLMLTPIASWSLALAGMTSALGRCHTFDVRADGYVRGEACSAIVLQSSSGLVGVGGSTVGGSTVRQDGRSASLTAPNGQAQHELIHTAHAEADASSADGLVAHEAHGTGTALGDPVEAKSLAVIGARRVAIGGVKACLGHTEIAAGLAGLLSVLQSLCSRITAPNSHLRVMNPHVRNVTNPRDAYGTHLAALWGMHDRCLGCVSSFGYSGTIAHAVLFGSMPPPGQRPVHLTFRRRAFPCIQTSEREAAILQESSGSKDRLPWLYSMQWSCASELAELKPVGASILVIGPSNALPTHPNRLANASACDACLLYAPRSALAVHDLGLLECVLSLLQVFQTNQHAPPLWLCTLGTQLECSRSTHAGLWGLARSARAELASLRLGCLDAPLQQAMPLAGYEHLQLPGGHIDGLKQAFSFEPEACFASGTMHVPRLVHLSEFPRCTLVGLNSLRQELIAHVTASAAKIDSQQLMRSYSMLIALCNQYISDAMSSSLRLDSPLWHHRLLRAWLATQHPTSMLSKARALAAAKEEGSAELALAVHCGERLVDALNCTIPYQELLFPGGSMERLRPVYEDATISQFYNGCMQAVLQVVLKRQPRPQPMVVLEVGAGTGGTTSVLLPILNGRCERYVFTDVSRVFLVQAQTRFAAFSFVQYSLLNIDADPRRQGFASAQFDLLIATNCLHATPLIRTTLCHCHQLLQPAGLMVVNEALTTDAFTQMTFGLTDGWWLFHESRDPERLGQSSPMLNWRQWEGLLRDTGFRQSHCMQGGGAVRGHAVIVAEASAAHIAADARATRGGIRVITGGLGGLGLIAARVIWDTVAPSSLVLMSRSGRLCDTTGAALWMGRCRAVRVTACDVADDTNLRTSLIQLMSPSKRLNGVTHLASAFSSGLLGAWQSNALQAMYGPKVHAAQTLHAALRGTKLDDFGLCGSAASVLDFYSKHQAPYAAANSAIASLATFRRGEGLKSTSIAWGALATTAGDQKDTSFGSLSRLNGLELIDHALVCTVLARSLVCNENVAVLQAHWSTVIASHRSGYLHSLTALHRAPLPLLPVLRSESVTRMPALSLQSILQMVMNSTSAAIEPDTPLMEGGMDSLAVVHLRNELQRAVGTERSLPPTLAIDYPTVRTLFEYLVPQQTHAEPITAPSRVSSPRSSTVAGVRGVSSALPGGATSRDALWMQSAGGVDSISYPPPTRPEQSDGFPVGLLGSITLFDNSAFKISAAEATLMDPIQRLHLERAYEAFSRSESSHCVASHRDIGVFVGIDKLDFVDVLASLPVSAFEVTSSGLPIAAGRVSYVLGLQGPCVANNTACASALVAVHSALSALQRQECSGALASGLNLILVPSVTIAFARAGMISLSGRCFTFDQRADGMGRGEACSTVLLEDAEVQTSVSGAMVRQDGRSASLTAPNGPAQLGLFNAVMSAASVGINGPGWYEAHGTGTKLGDPIEMRSYSAAVAGRGCVSVGSLKATTGHTEGASGLPGLLRAALTLGTRTTFPNAQLRLVSSHVAAVLSQAVCLPVQAGPLCTEGVAMVSAFGLTGTIASAVLARHGSGADDRAWNRISYRRRAFPWLGDSGDRFGKQRTVGAGASATYTACWTIDSERTPLPPVVAVLVVGSTKCGSAFVTARAPSTVAVLLRQHTTRASHEIRELGLVLALAQKVSRERLSLLVLSGSTHGGAVSLARVVRLELTALTVRSVAASEGAKTQAVARALLHMGNAEAEVSWSGGGTRLVSRLRKNVAHSSGRQDAMRSSGSYVITGGLGGLGVRAAGLLLKHGARRVVLSSRSCRLSAAAVGVMAEACVVSCDAACGAQIRALLQYEPTSGVLHAAGENATGLVSDVTLGGMIHVGAAKAVGAWHLHCGSASTPLECMVFFSSVGSGLSNVGQASYAAANGSLDGLALCRRKIGVVSLAVQWPMVGGAGMGAAGYALLASRKMSMVGMCGISLEEYAACLAAQLSVCDRGLERSVQLVHRSEVRELLSDLSDASERRFEELAAYERRNERDQSSALAAPASRSSFAESVGALPVSERRAHAEAAVLRLVEALVPGERVALKAESPLMEVGIDSLAATELASRLRALAGVPLSATLIFEHPTARAVAAHVLDQLGEARATSVGRVPKLASAGGVEIRVVSSSGRWPGGCSSEAACAQLTSALGDAVGSVPVARWVLSLAVDVKELTNVQASCVLHGGFLQGAHNFDERAFEISTEEAYVMDPQQRLLLEHGYTALHGAWHRRSSLLGGESGVFLGIERPDWIFAQPLKARASTYAMTGDNVSVAAGRLCFVLGLQGPCSSIDTACASALTAAHWASFAVKGGDCTDALALAVSLKLVPHGTLGSAAAGMLSVDGRCKTLDARANGYVRSEGVGALVMQCGGETGILFSGSAVRSDGRSASLTAPNGSAQRLLLLAALGRSNASLDEWSYVEAHGTGTALGDPTEVGAIAAVHATRPLPFVVGAVKASVGHAEAAAGQLGLLQLQQALQGGAAGNAQLRQLNPHVSAHLHGSASRHVLPAQRVATRSAMGGTSSFGYSGTIAHVVLVLRSSSKPLARPANGLRFRRRSFSLSGEALPPADPSWKALVQPSLGIWDAPLISSGLTSVGAVRLAARLRALTNYTLSPTLVFEFPTAHAISDHLHHLGVTMRADVLLGVVDDVLNRRPTPSPRASPRASPEMRGRSGPLTPSPPGTSILHAIPDDFVLHEEPEDVTTLLLQRPLPALGPHNPPGPSSRPTGPIQSPYLVDTLKHPKEYWYAVPTDVAAAQWWFRAHCSLRTVVACDETGRWRWNGQRSEDDLPQFESPRQLDDLSNLVYFCHGDRMLHLHHLLFDGFALRFLSDQTGTWHTAEADHLVSMDYHQYRTDEMLGDVFRVVSTPLFRAEMIAANRACNCYKAESLVVPPGMPALVNRISKENRVPLAEAFYATVIVLTLEALGVRLGPFLLTDNCRDSSNSKIFGMVQREYGAIFEHEPALPFDENVRRALKTMQCLAPIYRRLFAEFAFGEFGELYDENTYDGVQLNFLGYDGVERPDGDILGPSPIGDHLPWENCYETAMEAAMEEASGPFDFSSNLYCHLQGGELSVCGRETSVLWFVQTVWPLLLDHAEPPPSSAPPPPSEAGSSSEWFGPPASSPPPSLPPSPPPASPVSSPRLSSEPSSLQPALALPARASPMPTTALSRPAARPIRPYDVAGVAPELSPSLLAAYQAAHVQSKAYVASARPSLSDNRNIANFCLPFKEACHPIVGAAAAAGSCHVIDADGHRVIDLAGGFGAVVYGHNPPFVRDAVLAMVRNNQWALGWEHGVTRRNAATVCRLTGMESCVFVTTGSEATTLAYRLCRIHTGRSKVVVFENSYHGHFDAFLGFPADPSAPGLCSPVAPGIPASYTQDLIVLPYDTEASLAYIDEHAAKIAGVFCEAVQNRNPGLVPKPFLEALRQLTERRGIVLVFDEVVTGFRVAAGGVQEKLGIRCDLSCYGKALGGGYPVGCVAGPRNILAWVSGGNELRGGDAHDDARSSVPTTTYLETTYLETTYFEGTFHKHPLAMAAVGAVLDHIVAHGDALFPELDRLAEHLASSLNAWWAQQGLALRIDHFGSMIRFQVPPRLNLVFFQTLLQNGVYCWEGRTCFLTTAHTQEDVDEIIAACKRTSHQLAEEGIAIPGS
jgi:amino acid adenylation domain-containing protein